MARLDGLDFELYPSLIYSKPKSAERQNILKGLSIEVLRNLAKRADIESSDEELKNSLLNWDSQG
jgi:hypothetical protein